MCTDDSNNSTEVLNNRILPNTGRNFNTSNNIELNTNTYTDLNTNDESTNIGVDNLVDISEDIRNSLLIFIQNLYSFGIPSISINKILQSISELVNIVFDRILDNVDEFFVGKLYQCLLIFLKCI